jgi:hypothetical protein
MCVYDFPIVMMNFLFTSMLTLEIIYININIIKKI